MPVFGFKDSNFEVSTQSLGTLNFRRVTPEYAGRIDKADFQRDLPADAFLSLLIVILGSKHDGGPILVEEAYALSPEEREAFVHAFLNEHGEYYRERIREENTNEAGERITKIRLGDRIVNPRRLDEDSGSYLARLYRDFTSGNVASEIVSETSSSSTERQNVFAESLLKNAALSESLGKSLAQMKVLEGRDRIAEPPVFAETPAAPPSLPPTRPLPPLDFGDSNVDQVPASPPDEAFILSPPSEPETPIPASNPVAPAESEGNPLLAAVRELNASVQQLTLRCDDAMQAQMRTARSARRIAWFAVLLAILLPGLAIGYEIWRDGPNGRMLGRTLMERSAAGVAEQRQQIDALKALVEQMRVTRSQPSTRVAD